jgi:hypothetical protein
MSDRNAVSGLEELRRLEAAATPGPWRVERQGLALYVADESGELDWIELGYVGNAGSRNHAEFIAAARNQLPRILDALDAAEAAIVATVEHFRSGFDLDNREGKQHQANSNRAFGADSALYAFRAAITKALQECERP